MNANRNYEGNVPMGAGNDNRAPWNQEEPEAIEKEVDRISTLVKTATVQTDDYIPGELHVERDGGCPYTYREGNDFSETDFDSAWDHAHETPVSLIRVLGALCERMLDRKPLDISGTRLKYLIDECAGWEEKDVEYDFYNE